MINSRFAAALGGIALFTAAALSGCSASTPTPSSSDVVAPITKSANDLQGATVQLPTNTILNIDTGSLPVDSYTAAIGDPSIASFTQGHTDGGASFNPGIQPLKVGETQVTLTNAQGGIQPLVFTVDVVPAS